MRLKPILFGAGVLGVGFALYRYFKMQSDLLKNYEYKIVGIKPIKVTLTELTFQITIRFISKSSIEATVKSIYLDIEVEGKNVGYVTEVKPFVIPANGSSDIPLTISFSPKSVFGNVVGILLNSSRQKDLNFKLSGNVEVKSGFVKTTIPISYADKVSAYL